MPLDDGLDLETRRLPGPVEQQQGGRGGAAGTDPPSRSSSLSAGTDWVEDRLPPQATLCSARGARDRPVAEWVVAALLGAASRTLECARLDTWTEREVTELGSWTVLVVGMGSIGRRVGQLLAPFGTTVVGVASRAREDVHGVEELPDLLPAADAVVLLTPLTERTRGLIGAAELAAMRDGALLVNAARGAVVDIDALLAEVGTGRLRAVLDVTDPEPLPDGHPLWTASGVLAITPHIAGDSRARPPPRHRPRRPPARPLGRRRTARERRPRRFLTKPCPAATRRCLPARRACPAPGRLRRAR